ncbi:hypothetical protein [Streptomyces atratus]|uniref:hypothetical protein n=1 Tax=Streptomyces atratus TaxID=1893 RepID=UPI0033D22409
MRSILSAVEKGDIPILMKVVHELGGRHRTPAPVKRQGFADGPCRTPSQPFRPGRREVPAPFELAAELDQFLKKAAYGARNTRGVAVQLAELRAQDNTELPDLPDLYEPLILFYERGIRRLHPVVPAPAPPFPDHVASLDASFHEFVNRTAAVGTHPSPTRRSRRSTGRRRAALTVRTPTGASVTTTAATVKSTCPCHPRRLSST